MSFGIQSTDIFGIKMLLAFQNIILISKERFSKKNIATDSNGNFYLRPQFSPSLVPAADFQSFSFLACLISFCFCPSLQHCFLQESYFTGCNAVCHCQCFLLIFLLKHINMVINLSYTYLLSTVYARHCFRGTSWDVYQ